ncbi:MAG: phosphatidate cytidylyltransferase [Gammaproteobacteria bacterium]|nr:phosphatidate cytidylyltransferase [Gammaproteobacteria bacterium]
MNMALSARAGTALALMPLALGITLYGGRELFAGLCALVALAGAWEWAGLTAPRHQRQQVLARKLLARRLSALGLGILLLTLCYHNLDGIMTQVVMGLALLWWALALLLILRCRDGRDFSPAPLLQAIIGVLVLAPAWTALVALHASPELSGPVLVSCLFIMIWAADSGAYYVGRRWGKRKLVAHISPGKTVEGLLAALLSGLLAALLCALLLLQLSLVELALFMPVCLLAIAMSVVGDLTESLMKRSGGVKDSGGWLPGHGGALDRIDSLTAAAPVFFSGVLLLEQPL